MKFAPEYVRHVLTDNFDDAKSLFLGPLLSIHYAHLVMLAGQGILCPADARVLRSALGAISAQTVQLQDIDYDGTYEDLFFYLDRLIQQAAGETIAGRLHTARSRNDIDMTMYRMRQREFVLELLQATLSLRETWLEMATQHRETIFPAHTHTQPAQPTTVAHYLLGAIEQLERDAVRLRAAYEVTNLNPLGACAITGTGFPIDRARTTALLGFSAPTGNTYGSIATVDYMLQNLSAAAVTLVGVGRVVQDLLLWCTAEVHYLRLPDGFVQCSSIMPQKRNPVALEHARSIGSKALGQATAVFLSVHNTPFGDIVDTEDDLQPLVHTTFRDATRAISIIAAALKEATLDVASMRTRAEEGWITVTELADTLVRDHNLSFGAGHAIAAKLIDRARQNASVPLAEVLAEVSEAVTGTALTYQDADLREILSPAHFIEIRKTLGGPAPALTAEAIEASRTILDRDLSWLTSTRAQLTSSAQRLNDEVAAL
jgi:argininosuccinate lyase